jgi:hypothetical protein
LAAGVFRLADRLRGEEMRALLIGVAVPLVFSVCVGCAESRDVESRCAAPLITVPGAKNANCGSEYDGSITYTVEDPYPGSVTLERLGEVLAREGWSPTDQSPLVHQPDESTRQWWSYYEGETTKIYQWNGVWRNSRGDLVSYVLRYRVSPAHEQARTMEVIGVYTTLDTANKLRDASPSTVK